MRSDSRYTARETVPDVYRSFCAAELRRVLDTSRSSVPVPDVYSTTLLASTAAIHYTERRQRYKYSISERPNSVTAGDFIQVRIEVTVAV